MIVERLVTLKARPDRERIHDEPRTVVAGGSRRARRRMDHTKGCMTQKKTRPHPTIAGQDREPTNCPSSQRPDASNKPTAAPAAGFYRGSCAKARDDRSEKPSPSPPSPKPSRPDNVIARSIAQLLY